MRPQGTEDANGIRTQRQGAGHAWIGDAGAGRGPHARPGSGAGRREREDDEAQGGPLPQGGGRRAGPPVARAQGPQRRRRGPQGRDRQPLRGALRRLQLHPLPPEARGGRGRARELPGRLRGPHGRRALLPAGPWQAPQAPSPPPQASGLRRAGADGCELAPVVRGGQGEPAPGHRRRDLARAGGALRGAGDPARLLHGVRRGPARIRMPQGALYRQAHRVRQREGRRPQARGPVRHPVPHGGGAHGRGEAPRHLRAPG